MQTKVTVVGGILGPLDRRELRDVVSILDQFVKNEQKKKKGKRERLAKSADIAQKYFQSILETDTSSIREF